MSDKDKYAVGDELKIWITAVIGNFRARVIDLDERDMPVLRVLNSEDGTTNRRWAPFKLKNGDYIIRGRWGQ